MFDRPKIFLSTFAALLFVAAFAMREYRLSQETSSSPLDQQSVVLGDVDDNGFEKALVADVIDGDTVRLSDGRVVRYIGIDTPETKHPTKGKECFGEQASLRNTELVEGQVVSLETDVSETDRYQRLLRYVWLDGQLINHQLVSEGLAVARSYPPDIRYQELFSEAERIAWEGGVGLWSECPADEKATQIQKTIDEIDQQVLGSFEDLDLEKCTIKGNISSNGNLYHLPGCDSYTKTVISPEKGERWFCTEQEALDAGWQKAGNCP